MSRKRNTKMQMKAKCDGLHAIRNSLPTSPAEVQRVMVLIRVAYQKLKDGHGTKDDYDRLGAALNVGLVRSEAIDPTLVAMFMAAGRAMLACAQIHRKHGKFGFTGPHLLDMNAAIELYEQVLAASSPNQMQAAAEEGAWRMSRGQVIRA